MEKFSINDFLETKETLTQSRRELGKILCKFIQQLEETFDEEQCGILGINFDFINKSVHFWDTQGHEFTVCLTESDYKAAKTDDWEQGYSYGDTFVYVLGFENGFTKIGISDNLARRIPEVERDEKSRVIAAFVTKNAYPNYIARSYEKEMHSRFATYRDHGEYFDLNYKEIYPTLRFVTEEPVVEFSLKALETKK